MCFRFILIPVQRLWNDFHFENNTDFDRRCLFNVFLPVTVILPLYKC